MGLSGLLSNIVRDRRTVPVLVRNRDSKHWRFAQAVPAVAGVGCPRHGTMGPARFATGLAAVQRTAVLVVVLVLVGVLHRLA